MSKFNWKFITQKELKEVFEWWKHYGFKQVPVESLPKGGLIVSKDNINLYSCFIYFTDSNIAWLEWVVSNPKAPVDKKKGAFEYMLEVVEVILKLKGMKQIFISTNLPAFKNKLKKNEFEETDSNVTHYIKNI